MKLNETALYERIRKGKGGNAAAYLGAIQTLSEKLPELLARIQTTFPHYTSHSFEHGVRIVERVGWLLPAKTVKALSLTEIYVIIAGALLHDVGMVCPEREYHGIEKQATFQALKDDDRFRPYFDVAERALEGGDVWAAAYARRFLLAEWVRRRHADRSADFVLDPPPELTAAWCGDERLRECIAKVCRAHGFFDRIALENDSEFPRTSRVRDDQVDLAMCAILVRMGDLLDMDHERACMMVQAVAEPLPGDSAAHWGNHRSLTLFDVQPEGIRIEAKCANQDEHAVLHHWCGWLRDEAQYLAAIANGSKLLDVELGPTKVDIQPKDPTKYEFRQYRFELDEHEVFEKLFGERLYGNRCLFVRELLQNAIDATRCRVMDDVAKGRWDDALGIHEPSKRPTEPRDLPWKIREQYPITTSLEKDENGLTLTVEDNGVGMDHEVIRKYLLRVGKSYYRSSAFLSQYKFRPISEFGIGLLSCFMVSEHIEIDTCREGSEDGPIRLTIPPWRQYLTSRRSERTQIGTRVALRLYATEWLGENPYANFLNLDRELSRPVAEDEYGSLVQSILRHVEFPVSWRTTSASGRIVDPWESDGVTEDLRLLPNAKLLTSKTLDSGAEGRHYIGAFNPSWYGTYWSKGGVACCTDSGRIGFDDVWRDDIDLRASSGNTLTLDRLRFVDKPGFDKGLVIDLVRASVSTRPDSGARAVLLRALQSVGTHSWRMYGGSLNWLLEAGASAWCLVNGVVGSVPLQSIRKLVSEDIDLWVVARQSDVPSRVVTPRSVVIVVDELRDHWILAAAAISNMNRFQGVPVRSARLSKVRNQAITFEFGSKKAARLWGREWVIDTTVCKMLKSFGLEADFLAPQGTLSSTGAHVHLGALRLANAGDDIERQSEFSDLMATLRQYCPNLPEDFLTEEDVFAS